MPHLWPTCSSSGCAPIDYSPILLLKPFGFRIAPNTLSSGKAREGGFRSILAVSGFRLRSGRRMARYEPFPSSPLKFRTVGFPQSGFKAGLSDRTFLDVPLLKPSTRHSQCCIQFDLSFVRSAADIASGFRAPAYSALHAHRHAHGRFCRVTPGVLALVRCCRFRSVIT